MDLTEGVPLTDSLPPMAYSDQTVVLRSDKIHCLEICILKNGISGAQGCPWIRFSSIRNAYN
jgi:hypothetical protein